MGLAAALIVTAIGAILRWGVANQADGINLDTIGLILIGLGILGAVAALLYQYMDHTKVDRVSSEVVHKELSN
jgi:hypothetical protein